MVITAETGKESIWIRFLQMSPSLQILYTYLPVIVKLFYMLLITNDSFQRIVEHHLGDKFLKVFTGTYRCYTYFILKNK